MEDKDLENDLKNYLKIHLDPVTKKLLKQEKQKYEDFLKKHFEKYEILSEKESSATSQLITLEGAIFTAIVVLGKPEQTTAWLIVAICLILTSLFFGVWLQKISLQAQYQSHESNYYQELRNHWWRRELWKDDTVKYEKKLIEPDIEYMEQKHKKTSSYKILKFFRLTADRIESIFRVCFLVSVLFLIFHFTSISFFNSKPLNRTLLYKTTTHHLPFR